MRDKTIHAKKYACIRCQKSKQDQKDTTRVVRLTVAMGGGADHLRSAEATSKHPPKAPGKANAYQPQGSANAVAGASEVSIRCLP